MFILQMVTFANLCKFIVSTVSICPHFVILDSLITYTGKLHMRQIAYQICQIHISFAPRKRYIYNRDTIICTKFIFHMLQLCNVFSINCLIKLFASSFSRCKAFSHKHNVPSVSRMFWSVQVSHPMVICRMVMIHI